MSYVVESKKNNIFVVDEKQTIYVVFDGIGKVYKVSANTKNECNEDNENSNKVGKVRTFFNKLFSTKESPYEFEEVSNKDFNEVLDTRNNIIIRTGNRGGVALRIYAESGAHDIVAYEEDYVTQAINSKKVVIQNKFCNFCDLGLLRDAISKDFINGDDKDFEKFCKDMEKSICVREISADKMECEGMETATDTETAPVVDGSKEVENIDAIDALLLSGVSRVINNPLNDEMINIK